jgi:protein tyrosine/serine phosphatase
MNTMPRTLHELSTRRGRLLAWLHFYLKDHHLLRVWWWNLAEISPGVWRSNQPSPGRLKRYRALGIKSVVSLRGAVPKSYNFLEDAACAEHGIQFQYIAGITARKLVAAETILSNLDALAKVPKPLVFHCKSGADRTGFVAALYLILLEGASVEEAAMQLARKHIHFPRSRAGVLDHVFRVYLRDAEPSGVGFREWLEEGYDPEAITADFKDWRAGVGRWA